MARFAEGDISLLDPFRALDASVHLFSPIPLYSFQSNVKKIIGYIRIQARH